MNTSFVDHLSSKQLVEVDSSSRHLDASTYLMNTQRYCQSYWNSCTKATTILVWCTTSGRTHGSLKIVVRNNLQSTNVPSRRIFSRTLWFSKYHYNYVVDFADSDSCAAERYGLEELKRLALRKQGLRSGVQVGTILASARWAYNHTPDNDSKLRAHYLALIIRSRATFKRSGTMQTEMEQGGKMFFDLFVAMCNHMVSHPRLTISLVTNAIQDDLSTMRSPFLGRSPRTWPSPSSSWPVYYMRTRHKDLQHFITSIIVSQ